MSQTDREALLTEYPVQVTVPVLWGDMDAFGHVNNTVYLRYFESARIAYFRSVDFLGEDGDMRAGPILAATECRFKMPLVYPDSVDIGARVTDIGADRFKMLYRVVSHRRSRIAADGSGDIVVFDYVDKHKTALPAAVRRRIEALEAGRLV